MFCSKIPWPVVLLHFWVPFNDSDDDDNNCNDYDNNDNVNNCNVDDNDINIIRAYL